MQSTIDALRARVAKLEAALLVDGAKLLARNAKLETALTKMLHRRLEKTLPFGALQTPLWHLSWG